MAHKKTLWTKNYSLITFATIMGCMGGVAGQFAMGFLVFDETGSTLATGFLYAAEMVPMILVPLIASPWLDRLPRKPFLVGGDILNGILYFLIGVYLLKCEFSYGLYLCFSLLISALGAFDGLAYESLYPKLIPEGFSQKGYTVSGMLYPTVTVIMTPIAAILYEAVGVAVLLMGQGLFSIAAALIESRIDIKEERRLGGERFTFKLWARDLADAVRFLKKEPGLKGIYGYLASSSSVASGSYAVTIAFFRTAPGFSVAMYSAFSVAEFLGRTVGGLYHYKAKIPLKKRFSIAYFVYVVYNLLDAVLLFCPYSLMLLNRGICGFLGINSATLRESSVQDYIPDEMRAKLNAFSGILCAAFDAVGSILIGAMGEILDYRFCMLFCGLFGLVVAYLTIWRNRKGVKHIYNREFEAR